MRPKYFAIIFFSIYLLLSVSILVLSGWLEPFEGDLTRIGGKSENLYGWRAAQARFPDNLGRYFDGRQHYQGDEDLVLFGDSFSHMGLTDSRTFGWQNYLTAATGLSVFTYNHGHMDLADWLRRQPAERMPRYVIFQRSERQLGRIKSDTSECTIQLPAPGALTPSMIADTLASDWTKRAVRKAMELETAVHWLRSNLRNKNEVRVFGLERNDLFSNLASDRILIYKNDFLVDDKRYQDADPARLVCYLEELRALAEANGRTRFLLLVAPDKYTVYRRFIAAQDDRKNLFSLLEDQGLPVIRFDRIFQAQASAGVRDLYLPNDTHWGSEGSRLFASVVASVLLGKRGSEGSRQFTGRQANEE